MGRAGSGDRGEQGTATVPAQDGSCGVPPHGNSENGRCIDEWKKGRKDGEEGEGESQRKPGTGRAGRAPKRRRSPIPSRCGRRVVRGGLRGSRIGTSVGSAMAFASILLRGKQPAPSFRFPVAGRSILYMGCCLCLVDVVVVKRRLGCGTVKDRVLSGIVPPC